MTGPDKATRPWRLRGYRKDEKKPHRESTVRGDRALNDAMARLEADSTIVRITAEPAWA